jgi:GAF domain-containing protein
MKMWRIFVMDEFIKEYPFRLNLSLKPLIDCVRKSLSDPGSANALQAEGLEKLLDGAPELLGPIKDVGVLRRHGTLVEKLMSFIFPPVFWETEAVTAVIPFTARPIFVSPAFKQVFFGNDSIAMTKEGAITGRLNLDEASFHRGRAIKAYLLILSALYDIHQDFEYPLIRVVRDPVTGLDRHYRIKADFRFIEIRPAGELQPLSDEQRSRVLAHITEPKVLKEILPPEKFEMHGFTILHAVDVTESEMISALSRDLVDRQSLISKNGFERLQERLRALFRRPSLVAGLTAIREDNLFMLNAGCQAGEECIFSGSTHLHASDLKETVLQQAIREGNILNVPDMSLIQPEAKGLQPVFCPGARSLLVAPLHFKGECIGALLLGSPKPGDLGPVESLVVEQLRPIFALSIRRALDDLENRVQRIIKQECTAIHYSVEWRFRKAALQHLTNLRRDQTQQMEPIIFKDVHALYSATDIRGSTEERNRAIQRDLAEHLSLAFKVISAAMEVKPLPILRELAGRIRKQSERIEESLGTADEISIGSFIKEEVESIFPHLRGFGGRVADALRDYDTAVDGSLSVVHRARRDFESSVKVLNDRLVSYLDGEEAEAQTLCPHFFERHRTDGVDYLVYLGKSLVESGEFDEIYLKNLRLWQLEVACGMAWISEQVKPTLNIPLETAHLVLVQNSQLSIRFRFDEKRFDPEATYDLRHEIIRSRIQKAEVRGTGERLTQPGQVAIVYSHADEAKEMRRHIEFLQSEGYLAPGIQSIELADLSGLQGLRALRVSVNLKHPAFSERVERVLSGAGR